MKQRATIGTLSSLIHPLQYTLVFMDSILNVVRSTK